jgi:hypothetical protein
MTLAERRLLLVLARSAIDGPKRYQDALTDAYNQVMDQRPVVTPRAKHVTVVTPREIARGVAARWKDQRGNRPLTDRNLAIHLALLALGDEPDPDEAARIIGNQSWTHPCCDGCGDYVGRAVRIHGEYSSEGAYYCALCIGEAAQLLGDK